ncbi:MAG: GHKL domain-containing protein [Lachnospiraceae bacterium]|jgi:hypothetical protein|nr:GHKL domain-containing protein [Lachnospiraceae bacterium]
MTEYFYAICNFCYESVKAWLIVSMIASVAPPKRDEKIVRVIWGIGITAFSVVSTANVWIMGIVFSAMVPALMAVWMSVAGAAMYQMKWRDCFLLTFLTCVGFTLTDFLIQSAGYFCLERIGWRRDLLMTLTYERAIYLLLYLVGVSELRKRVCGWMGRNFNILKRYRLLWGMLCIGSVFTIVYFQRIYLLMVSNQYWESWGMFVLGITLCILIFSWDVARRNILERERLQEFRLEMASRDYEQIWRLYQEDQLRRHDERKHMEMIYQLARKEACQPVMEYMEKLLGRGHQGDDRIMTNHFILDMVLNVKKGEAEIAGISVEISCDDMSALAIQDPDICAIFANLLDNAIEANKKLKKEERWIRLSCKWRGNMLMVRERNPMAEKLIWRGDWPETTKKNRRIHGFGLTSIRETLKKYDGYMELKEEQGVFFLDFFLNGLDGEKHYTLSDEVRLARRKMG